MQGFGAYSFPKTSQTSPYTDGKEPKRSFIDSLKSKLKLQPGNLRSSETATPESENGRTFSDAVALDRGRSSYGLSALNPEKFLPTRLRPRKPSFT